LGEQCGISGQLLPAAWQQTLALALASSNQLLAGPLPKLSSSKANLSWMLEKHRTPQAQNKGLSLSLPSKSKHGHHPCTYSASQKARVLGVFLQKRDNLKIYVKKTTSQKNALYC
jgi:hypothetical protein